MKDETDISIILELKQNKPKHYIAMLKRHHTHIWNNIEQFNKNIQCDYEMSSPQMVFNYINNIQNIPLCPVTNTQLKFFNAKFEYRKFNGRGMFTQEFTKNRAKNHKYKPLIRPDYLSLDVKLHTFNEIIEEYTNKGLFSVDANQASQQLTWRFPELKKAIHQYYGIDKKWRLCHKWIRSKIENIDNKIYGYDGSIKEYTDLNEFKRKNRQKRIENAILLSKNETIKKLYDFINSQTHFHSIYQTLVAYQPEVVKSVLHYTQHLDLKKFTEKVYILLYGEPKLYDSKNIHNVFKCFTKGYEKRAYYGSYTSNGEQELSDYIQTLGFTTKKTKINHKEIDIYIPELQIGFEYNGIFWHSNAIVDKNYHINKTKLANDNNIKLYHIFEDNWKLHNTTIKNIIKQKCNLPSNNIIDINTCDITINVDHEKVCEFLNKNDIITPEFHHTNICALLNNEIVYCITFLYTDPPRICKINNCCGLINYDFNNIQTLITKFTEQYNYIDQIYNLVDICLYDRGEQFYENLGFKFVSTREPVPYFANPSNSTQRYDIQLYDKLLSDENDIVDAKTMNIEEYMKFKGYLTIYDCGRFVYKWDRP